MHRDRNSIETLTRQAWRDPARPPGRSRERNPPNKNGARAFIFIDAQQKIREADDGVGTTYWFQGDYVGAWQHLEAEAEATKAPEPSDEARGYHINDVYIEFIDKISREIMLSTPA
jgi:hypothetical protein